MDAERFLLAKYPGSNPVIKEHIRNAASQLLQGQTIGERATPVVSFWMMKEKWRKLGASWTRLGTDGDPHFSENNTFVYPDVIQLVYFVTTDDLVCQLAYWPKRNNQSDYDRYEQARVSAPDVIDRELIKMVDSIDAIDNNAIAEAANDIISHMNKFYI